MSKRLKIILTVSILLNVVLIGVGAGHAYKHWSSHSWHKVKQEISPEARNVAGRTFQQAFRDIRPLGQEARKARGDLVKILSADEFDEEAFDKAVERLSSVKIKIQDAKVQATRNLAMQLSVEERRKMAERMAKMVGGGREHRVKRTRNIERVRPKRKPDH